MVTRFALIIVLSIVALDGVAQENVDSDVVARIKEEAFQHSQVMDTLIYLSDVYGPRLTGSRAYYEAAEWTKQRLESWGIENVHFDSYRDDLRGWEIESYSVEMIAPRYMNITALPDAWTAGTNGEVIGEPIIVDYASWRALQELKGQLRGKILMSPEIHAHGRKREGVFTEQELKNAESHINPRNMDGLDNSDLGPAEGRRRRDRGESEGGNVEQFLLDEGVAAVIRGSSKAPGTLDAGQQQYIKIGDMKPVPHFVISREQHSRMARMIERDAKITLRLHLKTRFYTDPEYSTNIIAEMPGTDRRLKEQLVLVGGHFDSYQSATGASDNGAGCATTMEVMRILKTLGIKPRRTIRLVLWGSEEQGHLGSRGYINKYVADARTGEDKGELSRISVYFNHDNNGHNIRGIYTLGNEAIRPIFESYLEPFHYLGAETVTAEYAGGTDHVAFDALNIPAFEWIQDPMQYFYTQIHTSMDVTDFIEEDTLKRNTAIIATFVYHAAMRDEMMPRKKSVER
jgi:carboxypeptidase Q